MVAQILATVELQFEIPPGDVKYAKNKLYYSCSIAKNTTLCTLTEPQKVSQSGTQLEGGSWLPAND